MADPLLPDFGDQRLESWKEIAAYLKRDVRTARRWEKTEGLPVHRHVHHKLATVYAFKPELDIWRANRKATTAPDDPAVLAASAADADAPAPTPSAVPAKRLALVALIVVATVAALTALRASRRPPSPTAPPTGQRIAGRLLAAATGEGQQPVTVAPVDGVTALELSLDGERLYFTERDRKVLQVLSTRTNRIDDTISLPGRPNQLRFSADRRWAYVGTEEGDVLRVDLVQRAVETLARGLTPVNDLAITENGDRVYATSVFNGLHVLDRRSGQVQAIPTVRCPMHVAIVPGKDLAYVSYQCGGPGGRPGHDAIDVRIASSGAAKATITGPPQVGGEIRASPDGAQVWLDGRDACSSSEYDRVGCPGGPSGLINVYRVDDNYLLGSIALTGATRGASGPGALAFFPDSSRVVAGGPTIKVIDARSLSVVEEAELPASGRAAISPDGSRAYVVLMDKQRLALFDLTRDTCLPAPSGLAGWWTGDGHANDVHEDNPGEPRHGAAFAPAWVGQGFALNGRGAYVQITNVSSMNTASDFSVAAWIKPLTSGRTETILDQGRRDASGWKLMRHDDDTLSVCYFDADNGECPRERLLRSAVKAPAGRWTHVVAVASGKGASLFVQGGAPANARLTPRRDADHQDFRIGASFGEGGFFAGVVDEVQLFRRALSADDVRRIYSAGRSGLCYR